MPAPRPAIQPPRCRTRWRHARPRWRWRARHPAPASRGGPAWAATGSWPAAPDTRSRSATGAWCAYSWRGGPEYSGRPRGRQCVEVDTLADRRAPLGGQQGARLAGRLALRELVDNALPRRAGARRVVQILQAIADLQQRIAGLGRARGGLQDLLELGLGLPIVVLDVVRLTDPVLRVRHQRVLGILGDEVQEIQDRLTVLARAERRECRLVRLLG